ncbi:hypothetical protein [Metabacillus fastidiosus]|nr:hypothetical protein [Metabacillus fastidiosus]MED4461835.1 hypothetical protein [Metabacillus fastidiosus]
MNDFAKFILEQIISGEKKAESGILKAAVDEILKLRKENENLRNPQIW